MFQNLINEKATINYSECLISSETGYDSDSVTETGSNSESDSGFQFDTASNADKKTSL